MRPLGSYLWSSLKKLGFSELSLCDNNHYVTSFTFHNNRARIGTLLKNLKGGRNLCFYLTILDMLWLVATGIKLTCSNSWWWKCTLRFGCFAVGHLVPQFSKRQLPVPWDKHWEWEAHYSLGSLALITPFTFISFCIFNFYFTFFSCISD